MDHPLLAPGMDGHTHTSFCPHGDRQPTRLYLEHAVDRGLRRLAITEHLPLPDGFHDPMGPHQCAMPPEDLLPYLDEAEQLRAEFADHLDVLVGAEVDWLGSAQGGWHEATLAQLDSIWDRLAPEATLLSVHFIDGTIVDGNPDLSLAYAPGEPPDAYHLAYYDALDAALRSSWTVGRRDLRPRRIGHLTLPRKFIRALPLAEPERVEERVLRLLERIAAEGLQLDYNTAGLDKEQCGETYLPAPYLRHALDLGIELVHGSDAHAPERVGNHRDVVAETLRDA